MNSLVRFSASTTTRSLHSSSCCSYGQLLLPKQRMQLLLLQQQQQKPQAAVSSRPMATFTRQLTQSNSATVNSRQQQQQQQRNYHVLSSQQQLQASESQLSQSNKRPQDCFDVSNNDPKRSHHHQLQLLQQQRTFVSRTYAVEDQMKDEYGTMDDSGETFVVNDYRLENGVVLPQAQLRYQTYGSLNAARDNVVVVCHALTGNASLHSWWGDLLGDGRSTNGGKHAAFDTSQYFIVCCNILGSCYGSTNPTSINPLTNQVYGKHFPDISVRDTVRLQLLLLQNELKVKSIKCVIGGSFGGMQALEFAVQAGTSLSDDLHQPADYFFILNDDKQDDDDLLPQPFLRSVLPIACGAQHTAWQIAISEVQRQAIYHDPAWNSSNSFQATSGLQVARQMGMISYRTPMGYQGKFGRKIQHTTTATTTTTTANDDSTTTNGPDKKVLYGSRAYWKVKSYLEYQGQKFLSRFDPVTYVKLTEQMDSHDVARGRCLVSPSSQSSSSSLSQSDRLAEVLGRIHIPALVLGIDSDVLYPLSEQEEIVQHLPNSTLAVIHSEDGHDGFLLEQEQVGSHIIDFLQRHQ